VARGFESKSVIDQQEAEESRIDAREAPTEPVKAQRRRTLELARLDVVYHLEHASAKPHRLTLRRALEAIDAELAKLGEH
jgi:hypothetical protein